MVIIGVVERLNKDEATRRAVAKVAGEHDSMDRLRDASLSQGFLKLYD